MSTEHGAVLVYGGGGWRPTVVVVVLAATRRETKDHTLHDNLSPSDHRYRFHKNIILSVSGHSATGATCDMERGVIRGTPTFPKRQVRKKVGV